MITSKNLLLLLTIFDSIAKQYEKAISLFYTIPGVDRTVAVTIISETDNDMTQPGSSKRLCCQASLTIGSNESAGISRAGAYLKPALVQTAHAAVKDRSSPYYRLSISSFPHCGKKQSDIRH